MKKFRCKYCDKPLKLKAYMTIDDYYENKHREWEESIVTWSHYIEKHDKYKYKN